MSVVASRPAVNADMGGSSSNINIAASELNPEDHSPSRFTAVNGREDPPGGPSRRRPSASASASASASPTPPAGPADQARSQSFEQPLPAHQKGGELRGEYHNPNKRKRASSLDNGTASSSNLRSPSLSPVLSSRSQTAELNGSSARSAPDPAASDARLVNNHVASGNVPSTLDNDNDNNDNNNDNNDINDDSNTRSSPDPVRADGKAPPTREQRQDGPNPPPPPPQQQQQQQQYQQNGDASDTRLADALQQDVRSSSASSASASASASAGVQSWDPTTNTNGSTEEVKPSEQPPPPTQSSVDQPQRASGEGRPKKKRNFSNRTKTGCMTCRRRKKKCDERHPECNNCIRGDFRCEGYGPRTTYPRQPHATGPVPLEPRDRYTEVTSRFVQDVAPQRPPISTGPPAAHANGTGSRLPSMGDADRNMPPHIATSPNGSGSRTAWPTSAWPQSPFVSERAPKAEPRDGAGLNDLSRAEHHRTDYSVVQQQHHQQRATRDLSGRPAGGRPGMSVFPTAVDQRPPTQAAPPPIEAAANFSAQARQALNSMPPEPLRNNNALKSEKEKMRAGEKYLPSDPELVEDRRRCKAALARFENAQNPLHEVSEDEKTRLLHELLRPRRPVSRLESPFMQNLRPLGAGIVIEPPFRCHYGYNIDIGPDVMISEDCTLVDDCTISIGAHTWIGQGVQIITSMAAEKVNGRKGSKSHYGGGPVTIECDCWIGPRCTILPGVTLYRGSRILAGAVVKNDVRPYDTYG